MIVGGISGGVIVLCIFGFIGRNYPKSVMGKFVNFITGSRLAIFGFCLYVLYLIFVELPMAVLWTEQKNIGINEWNTYEGFGVTKIKDLVLTPEDVVNAKEALIRIEKTLLYRLGRYFGRKLG